MRGSSFLSDQSPGPLAGLPATEANHLYFISGGGRSDVSLSLGIQGQYLIDEV
jgi:hypothetical protein